MYFNILFSCDNELYCKKRFLRRDGLIGNKTNINIGCIFQYRQNKDVVGWNFTTIIITICN